MIQDHLKELKLQAQKERKSYQIAFNRKWKKASDGAVIAADKQLMKTIEEFINRRKVMRA